MALPYQGKFDIGQRPTDGEWEIYRRVFAYDQRENVASWIESNRPDATQEQFEKTYALYADYWRNDGEHDWELIWMAYEDATREERKANA